MDGWMDGWMSSVQAVSPYHGVVERMNPNLSIAWIRAHSLFLLCFFCLFLLHFFDRRER